MTEREKFENKIRIKSFCVNWLGPCPDCGNKEHTIRPMTHESTNKLLFSGDDVECDKCGLAGVIDADGENAWVDWCEEDLTDE